MSDKPDNLHQKLLAIQKAVVTMEKDGFNKHHKYDFVSSDTVLKTFRKAMDEAGVLLIPTIVKTRLHLAGDRNAKMNLLELDVDFTWVNTENPDDKLTVHWYAQGMDTGEQISGKALTYAEKTFLLKFFHSGTDGEDPDSFERPQADEAPAAQKQEAAPLLGDEGKAKFDNWLEGKAEVGLTIGKELPGFLRLQFGVDTVAQVLKSDGQTLLGWATQRAEELANPTEEQQAEEFYDLQKEAEALGVPLAGLGTAAELREQIAKVEQAKGESEDGAE